MTKECKNCQKELRESIIQCDCGSTKFKHFTFVDKLMIGMIGGFSGLFLFVWILEQSQYKFPEGVSSFFFLIPMGVILGGRIITAMFPTKVKPEPPRSGPPLSRTSCKKCGQFYDGNVGRCDYCNKDFDNLTNGRIILITLGMIGIVVGGVLLNMFLKSIGWLK